MSLVTKIPLPRDSWVKIATGVSKGNIYLFLPNIAATDNLMNTDWEYFVDSKPTGAPGPTDFSTAMSAIIETTHSINDTAAIDVYVYSKGLDGSVRLEL